MATTAPQNVARVTPPRGTVWDLARNRDITTGSGKLAASDVTISTDRIGVWRQWEMVAGFPVDHSAVADQAAMLALHTFDQSATTQPLPRYVAPGDSCTRTDDPGWRWFCLREHGTAVTDWERRPLSGALEGIAVEGHTHGIDDITGLSEALDDKQDTLTTSPAGLALLAVATPAIEKVPQINPDGTVSLVDMGGGGSSATLVQEIMADAPTAYWRCNDASGAVLDSAGNGHDLTVSGTPVRSFARLARGVADEHIRWSNGYASRAGSLGITPPWSGSWSLRFTALLPDALAGEQGVFAVGLAGQETEASNYQLYASITTGRLPALVWEYSSGSNVVFSPGADITLGRRADVIWTKDAAAKIVRCYVNGACVFSATYTQEPTGGGSSIVDVGRNSNNGTVGGAVIGHIALYYGVVLTPARVQAHAEAAGVM